MRLAKSVHNVWIFIVLCLQSSICFHSYKKAEAPQPLDPWSLITCKTDRQADGQTGRHGNASHQSWMDHLIISCEGIVTLPPFALLSLFSPSPLSENGIGILFAFQIAFFLLVCKCAKLLMEMNVFSSWIVDLSFVSCKFILLRGYGGNFHLELDSITHLVNLQ